MPMVVAIVLAAGASSRFGPTNKLLAEVGGKPMIVRVVEAIAASPVGEIIIVTGRDRDQIEDVLRQSPIRFAHNDAWQNGMASSIRTGVAALAATTEAAFIVPGDMPFLTAHVVVTLLNEFEQTGRHSIVFPTTLTGEQRNPVLWPARFFGVLADLEGDRGAKHLLQKHSGAALAVPFSDEQVFADVDTVGELEQARTDHPARGGMRPWR